MTNNGVLTAYDAPPIDIIRELLFALSLPIPKREYGDVLPVWACRTIHEHCRAKTSKILSWFLFLKVVIEYEIKSFKDQIGGCKGLNF